LKELKAFAKKEVSAGETTTFEISLLVNDWVFYNKQKKTGHSKPENLRLMLKQVQQ
jgi:hypothetical protein